MADWRARLFNDLWLARTIVTLTIATVLIAGLIEFNARRQAVAVARALLESDDPADIAQLKAILQRAQATATVRAATPVPLNRATADRDIEYLPGAFPAERATAPPASTAPLGPNEKCVDGVRVRRIPGGWEQVNKDGC